MAVSKPETNSSYGHISITLSPEELDHWRSEQTQLEVSVVVAVVDVVVDAAVVEIALELDVQSFAGPQCSRPFAVDQSRTERGDPSILWRSAEKAE